MSCSFMKHGWLFILLVFAACEEKKLRQSHCTKLMAVYDNQTASMLSP